MCEQAHKRLRTHTLANNSHKITQFQHSSRKRWRCRIAYKLHQRTTRQSNCLPFSTRHVFALITGIVRCGGGEVVYCTLLTSHTNAHTRTQSHHSRTIVVCVSDDVCLPADFLALFRLTTGEMRTECLYSDCCCCCCCDSLRTPGEGVQRC